MNYLWMLGNGAIVVSTMICAGLLYRYHWSSLGSQGLIFSFLIIGVTAFITGLQFIFPEILVMLRRDLEGLHMGQWWRIITPIFVQPNGWFQCIFNGIFMLVFLPLAAKLYGKGLLWLYFISGLAGQLINYSWSPYGGGSSTAIFGTMGGVLMYICYHRKKLAPQYFFIAISGLCAAGLLSFARDGHGPSLLAGALVAVILLKFKVSGKQAAVTQLDI